MLYINEKSAAIIKAKKEHYKIVSSYLRSRHNRGSELKNFIHDNLDDLLVGKPDILLTKNEALYNTLPGFSSAAYYNYIKVIRKIDENARDAAQEAIAIQYEALHNEINKVINYENWFIKSDKLYDYQLTINLDRNSCTYCNRNYTHTIKADDDKRIMRPQLDHWYPKSKYPLLALSFYNLIPSCVICNSSIKSAEDFDINTHIHPYIDNIIGEFSFAYDYDRSLKKYKISVKTSNSKLSKTLEDMRVADIYGAHQLELKDLIKTKKAYTVSYLNTLKSSFPKANLNNNEIYRLAFGAEMESDKFHERPLSKFKSDILKELGIIKK